MAKKRKPRLARRLRVVRDDTNKTECRTLRDVYLESSANPWVKDEATGAIVAGQWKIELSGIQVPCIQVADMVRWCESLNIGIEYDPPNNMSGWLSKKASEDDGLQYLFDNF